MERRNEWDGPGGGRGGSASAFPPTRACQGTYVHASDGSPDRWSGRFHFLFRFLRPPPWAAAAAAAAAAAPGRSLQPPRRGRSGLPPLRGPPAWGAPAPTAGPGRPPPIPCPLRRRGCRCWRWRRRWRRRGWRRRGWRRRRLARPEGIAPAPADLPSDLPAPDRRRGRGGGRSHPP